MIVGVVLIAGALGITLFFTGALEFGYWLGGVPHEARQKPAPTWGETHNTGDPIADYREWLLAEARLAEAHIRKEQSPED